MYTDLKVLLQDAGFGTPDGSVDMARAAERFGVNKETVRRWLAGSPPQKAVVDLLKIMARGVETNAVKIPIVGKVDAGALTMRWEHPLGHVEVVPRSPQEVLFGLIVDGDSMSGAGILPGDLVIVRQQDSADSGDVVVALVDDEATLKRLRFRGGHPMLVAEKPGMEPIRPRSELKILGKVIEVRRLFETRA